MRPLTLQRLILSLLLLASLVTPAHAAGHAYVLVVDVSASRSPQDLNDAKSFLNALTQQLNFDDEIIVLQMQQAGLKDRSRHWMTTLPGRKDQYDSARDRQTLESKVRGIRLVLPTFFTPGDGAVLHTDILATTQLISEFLHDSGGRRSTVIFLSDMLQSAQGIEMERGARLPPPDFIAKKRSLGLIPTLPEACVVVVGADPTTRVGVQVEHFWQQYFSAAGAHLSGADFRYTPPASLSALCK